MRSLAHALGEQNNSYTVSSRDDKYIDLIRSSVINSVLEKIKESDSSFCDSHINKSSKQIVSFYGIFFCFLYKNLNPDRFLLPK